MEHSQRGIQMFTLTIYLESLKQERKRKQKESVSKMQTLCVIL